MRELTAPAGVPDQLQCLLPPPSPLLPASLTVPHSQGYDLSEEPDFWPPVVDTPQGRRIVTTMET